MTAFMFPGLGDHYLGMGLELYGALPVYRETIDRCAELLRPELDVDIREVMHRERSKGLDAAAPKPGLDLRRMLGREDRAPSQDERRLNETKHAQPALFAVEYAMATQWQAWGLQPEMLIGYSLGEYVAACLSGVFSLADALTLVARRARLIESLPAGAMLAVTLSERDITPLLGDSLSLSAVNGPEFCVVAGPPDAVHALEERLRTRGVAVRRVQSSHAFHSTMMEPVAAELTCIVEGFERHAPRIPYVSNVTGAPITAAEATDATYWATHLCRTVRFAEGLGAIPSSILLEVGPGQTLSSLAAVPSAKRPGRTVVASMRHAYDPESDTAVLRKALDGLRAAGANLAWDTLPSAWQQPAAEPTLQTARPPTKTEHELSLIWQKLLKCEAPSLDANFFKLGGNSLLATRLVDRVSKSLRTKLTLRRVYEAPTIAAMAAVIDGASNGVPARPAPRDAEKPPFRLPNGLLVSHQNEAETRHFYDDIFAHRSYVRHGIVIPDGGCVFDVGGNIGLFTLFAHTEAKNVRVFTFEPAPPLFDIVKRNVERHGIRANVFNCGLSNRECEAPFTFYPHSAGMSSFFPDEAEEKHNLRTIIDNQRRNGFSEAAQMSEYAEELLDVRFAAVPFTAKLRRISDVIREQKVERIDLMKVDVQKCELEVIEGIDEADWPKFSQIVLEAHDVDGRVAALTSLFETRGFEVIAEQDELYVGTNIHNIYAIRRGS